MFDFLRSLDRRWVFLLMGLAVLLPIIFGLRFPEEPSPMVRKVHDTIESTEQGSTVLMAWDYDPGSQGELQPMASAFTRHCAERKHKMIFLTLWPQGGPMIERSIRILKEEYPHYKYGVDYVNLGYRPGLEGVIKVAVSDMKELFTSDAYGTSLNEIPLTKGMKNIQNVDLLVNVSAGDPGSKQWVQYAATPYNIKMVAGTTGVQAPALYPYIPEQLIGVLGAIKAAAEYEQTIIETYPKFEDDPNAKEGLRRMGPQFVAHSLMIVLIVIGNIIFFVGRKRGLES